jgi:hypothetical protein
MLFIFSVFPKIDLEQNELDSIFEEEVSDYSSDNSVFSNVLNSPLKNLDLDDDNNNNNNNIIKENSRIYFSSDDSIKKIKRKRVTLDSNNKKLRKYTNMKKIFFFKMIRIPNRKIIQNILNLLLLS